MLKDVSLLRVDVRDAIMALMPTFSTYPQICLT